MAEEQIIDINEEPGPEGSVFEPPDLEAAVGDLVYWRNNTGEAHQPAPKGEPPSTWMDYPISSKLPDQPPPTSQQAVTYDSATTVEYYCALHPDRPEETGTIDFT
jgi:plastocyanin